MSDAVAEEWTPKKPGKTPRQARAIKALADPKIPTVRQAAEAAKLSRSHVHKLMQNETFRALVEAEQERQSDKARGFSKIAKRLMGKGLAALEEANPLDQVQVAGSVLKLVKDYGDFDDDQITPADHKRARRWRRQLAERYRRFVRFVESRPQHIVLSPNDPQKSLD